MSFDRPSGLQRSGEHLFPTFQPPQLLDIYDARGASFEVQLALMTAAGIINRVRPHVYLLLKDDDLFWLDHVFHAIPQKRAAQTGEAALFALLDAYRTDLRGLIIYDPSLPDTINVATTLAGQRDGLVVAPDLAQTIQEKYQLPLIEDLRVYGWHTRLQAYHWAVQHLLSSAAPRLIAGLNPQVVAGLRSFLVASRTFVYWLDSRDYLPNFSVGLLSERALMQQILRSFPPGSAHLGWFIDESSGVYLTSRSAMIVLASDFFANLEVWSAMRPDTVQVAPLPAPIIAEPDKRYISFTMSDGDNLQYLQHRMLHLWNDAGRGRLPIGWTFSPVALSLAPALAAYYTSTATANDELIAGPSGAGYIYPSHWPADQLPAYLQHTGQLMQAMNMTTLEVLDASLLQSSGLPLASYINLNGMVLSDEARQRAYVKALAPYGLHGILSGSGMLVPQSKIVDDIPLYDNLGLASGVQATVAMIKGASLLHKRRPSFMNVYVLAWNMTPSDLLQVMEQLGGEYEAVLPGTLLAMLAHERDKAHEAEASFEI
jgi:hypothetical protein